MNINALRESMKARREQTAPEECLRWSSEIAARCLALEAYQASQSIALYIPHRQEVDTTLIVAAAWKDNKQVYLPVLAENMQHLYFVAYTPDTVLEKNRFGIFEPRYLPADRINCDRLELVIAPLVAFDTDCHRIGMGAGFYDRSFYFLNQNPRPAKPILIGLAYDFQQEETFTRQPWDVNLNYIVTESQVYSLDVSVE
jgi:5-formyltetrahydrofolate cyclo-ligase